MPNGTPDFHEVAEPEYERFFAPIATQLRDFARRHNLKLEKYYHEAPAWSFLFRHPLGGVGKVDVEKESDTHCTLRKCWWCDDYEAGIRSLRQAQTDAFQRSPEGLADLLDDALRDILSWPDCSWTEQHGGFSDIWQTTWSRDAFNQLELAYPAVIP
jgi:hypothetical protein